MNTHSYECDCCAALPSRKCAAARPFAWCSAFVLPVFLTRLPRCVEVMVDAMDLIVLHCWHGLPRVMTMEECGARLHTGLDATAGRRRGGGGGRCGCRCVGRLRCHHRCEQQQCRDAHQHGCLHDSNGVAVRSQYCGREADGVRCASQSEVTGSRAAADRSTTACQQCCVLVSCSLASPTVPSSCSYELPFERAADGLKLWRRLGQREQWPRREKRKKGPRVSHSSMHHGCTCILPSCQSQFYHYRM